MKLNAKIIFLGSEKHISLGGPLNVPCHHSQAEIHGKGYSFHASSIVVCAGCIYGTDFILFWGKNEKKKKKNAGDLVVYPTLTVVIHTASEHCTATC